MTLKWEITGILLILAMVLVAFLLDGCVPDRDSMATTIEAAESMTIVENARKEAETAAGIAKMNAYVELGCWIGVGICGFLVGVGMWLKSKAMIVISGLAGMACIAEAILLTAKATHPVIIAWVGLAIILTPIVTGIVILILNRRALVQVVYGNEHFKDTLEKSGQAENDFRHAQQEAQGSTLNKPSVTEKIVDSIRGKKNV